MSKLIEIPHEVHESTCYVNGLFDIITWRGAKYDYFLLPVIGGMASFAYLKFKTAKPPYMVYWGNNPKYLLRQLEEIIGGCRPSRSVTASSLISVSAYTA